MENDHIIADNTLRQIEASLADGEQWFAYNTASYFLEPHDVFSFKAKDEAKEFAANNISDADAFHVINAASVADVFRRLSYGNGLDQALSIQAILKTNVMDNTNYDFLKEQLLKTGFGETLNKELANKMSQGEPEFHLQQKNTYGEKSTEAILHFRKSNESDRYFFNSYDIQLKNKEGDVAKQTFYISKGNTYTQKEAFNMLDGRSVHKTLTDKQGEKYQAWVNINFNEYTEKGNHKLKQYHQNYGYDLEKNLEKFPIKELGEAQSRERLIKSLEKGNLQQATLQLEAGEQKVFITPNLAFKSLSAVDEKGQKISLTKLSQGQEQAVTQQQEQTEKQATKKQQTQKQGNEPVRKQNRKQKVH